MAEERGLGHDLGRVAATLPRMITTTVVLVPKLRVASGSAVTELRFRN
jgi:hypothetical protein